MIITHHSNMGDKDNMDSEKTMDADQSLQRSKEEARAERMAAYERQEQLRKETFHLPAETRVLDRNGRLTTRTYKRSTLELAEQIARRNNAALILKPTSTYQFDEKAVYEHNQQTINNNLNFLKNKMANRYKNFQECKGVKLSNAGNVVEKQKFYDLNNSFGVQKTDKNRFRYKFKHKGRNFQGGSFDTFKEASAASQMRRLDIIREEKLHEAQLASLESHTTSQRV